MYIWELELWDLGGVQDVGFRGLSWELGGRIKTRLGVLGGLGVWALRLFGIGFAETLKNVTGHWNPVCPPSKGLGFRVLGRWGSMILRGVEHVE